MEIKQVNMSSSIYINPQSPIADNLTHYRNIYASPENFILRKVDYSKMRVYNEKYRQEAERLKSLENLKINNKELIPLIAKSGFYFKENSTKLDEARCIYCQGNLSDWKKNDVPIKRHKFKFPTCPYIIYLNVGNEPLGYGSYKSPNEDPDFVKPTMIMEIIIYQTKIELIDDFFDKLDFFDVDYREKTFKKFENLKQFAFRGFYIFDKDSSSILKCNSCLKEIPILNGICEFSDELLHNNNCNYRNIEAVVIKEISESSLSTEYFCEVEYSVITQEVDARMDMRYITKLLQMGIDRERLRELFEHQLKTKGKDFDSLFDLIHELKKNTRYVKMNYSIKEPDFTLTDFQCVVCLDKPVEVVFLPCGHLKTCEQCSELVTSCPVCRFQIEKRVKKFRFNS